MISIQKYSVHFLFLSNILQIQCLVELPSVEDNNIATVETAIRSTANKIFAALKIPGVRNRSRLKQFSTIHDYFISITLTDCDNLKKIARLVRVVNIDNNIQHFITKINEILNDVDKSDETTDTDNIYVTKYIEEFIRKLKYLKEMYVSKSNSDVINTDLLKYIDNDARTILNAEKGKNDSTIEEVTDENILSDNEFWRLSGRRVWDGIRTEIKRFPFIASVQFFKKFQCAGSIIQNDLVITSASCLQILYNNRFFRENPSFVSVEVGSDFYEGGGENIEVLEIYFHPEYDAKYLSNNLAIMRLTRKISFKRSKKRIKKIDFDRSPTPLPINSPKITLIGWGAKDASNIVYDVFRNKLSYADLDYYLHKDCEDHYSKNFVKKQNFCAGFYSRGGGACNRDSGGPGIIQDILVGVVSYGSPKCGNPDAPTVFTKLGYYANWIEGIIEQVVPFKHDLTTTIPPKTVYAVLLKKPTMPKVVYPVSEGSTPPPFDDTVNSLRIGQDQSFKEFLSSIFTSKEIQEYLDNTSLDTQEMNKDESIDTSNKLSDDSTENVNAVAKSTTESLRSSKAIKTPGKVKSTKHELNKESSEFTTESDLRVTILDNASREYENLEEDMLHLVNNLALNKLFVPEKPLLNSENNTRIKQSYHDEFDVLVTKDTNHSNYATRSPKVYVTHLLFASIESNDSSDKEEAGLSIPAKPFKDLTLRDKPNNTKASEVLSETALDDLVSLIIEEEVRRKHKKVHYIL